MDECAFCRIASGEAEAVVLYEDDEIMAFLDRSPIRPGHAHIIPKRHFETFEVLPSDLAGRIIAFGQLLARKMKTVYGVNRVAFLFTGGDIAHTHAHVIPMIEKTDITSARYIVSPQEVRFASEHLRVDRQTLLVVRHELGMEV